MPLYRQEQEFKRYGIQLTRQDLSNWTLKGAAFLKDWKGKYLHCDGYSGYKKLENVTLCGYLVHAKRKFHEAWQAGQSNEDAKKGETYIQELFRIESEADQLNYTDEQRLELRKTKSKKKLDEFYSWIDEINAKTLPQSLLGKAITYAINQS